MSGIVNCSVVRRGRVVYPWKIHSITVFWISVSEYYYDVIRPEISSKSDLTSEEFQLCEAYLGNSKDKLDAIDLALPLEDAVAIFGHFLKYVVHIFCGLMYLPDPTPCSDGHYKTFAEIFEKETSENHRPSLQKKPKKKKTSISWCITTC